MKHLFFFIALFFSLISCTVTKPADPKTDTISEQPQTTGLSPAVQSSNIPGSPGAENENRIQESDEAYIAMVDSLKLTTEQAVQFEAITIYYREKMNKLREEARSSGSGFQGMREQFQKLRTDQSNALKNLLTENQFAIYNTYTEKIREDRMRQRDRG